MKREGGGDFVEINPKRPRLLIKPAVPIARGDRSLSTF